MQRHTLVVGAGMVGVSIAWHMQQRGRQVTLIDRRPPGDETSFGNAGIIQREAVAPYAFPHDIGTLLRVLPNRSIDIRYRPSGMWHSASPLYHYWRNAFPDRYREIVPAYAALIMRSTEAHNTLIKASGAENLVEKKGWLQLFRTHKAWDQALADAQSHAEHYGVEYERIDRSELDRMQPGLSSAIIGAIHWQNSWTVKFPGDLVKAYAHAFEQLGGQYQQTALKALHKTAQGWSADTSENTITADEVVIALGPWAGDYLKPLGYHLPLFVKRGYHMHYQQPSDHPLQYWIMDSEVGYLLEPMTAGIRLTTGAELADRDDQPHYDQLAAAEAEARSLFNLGTRVDAHPWKGARPCTPDMKPIIGPAPHHPGLWLAFGHAHQGFTLGPATGELLAMMMEGETPPIDMTPYSVTRFL